MNKYFKKILGFTLAMVMVFSLGVSSMAADPKAVAKSESEPNNTMAQANVVNQDDSMYGKISSSTDVDFFQVVLPLSGNANFWLGDIPNGKDYDLYVYNSSGTEIGKSTGNTSTELVTLSVSAGATYYFKVIGYNGSFDATNQYKVRCKLILNTYNYFCQGTASYSSPSYSTTNLSNLHYKNTDGTTSALSWLKKIQDGGCVASSYAMILKNLGATTTSTRYDVRTGNTSYLQPDPFTVTLANTLFPSISNPSGTYIANTTRNPVYMYHADAIGGFGKSYTSYTLSGTDANKANAIAYQLSLHPEGVAVSFEAANGNTHTVVFISTTHEVPQGYTFSLAASYGLSSEDQVVSYVSEESIQNWVESYSSKASASRAAASSYDQLFTVCDPISTSTVSGNQVLFGNAYIASAYGFSTAYKMVVIR